jgi:hypothetical protein
MLTEFTDNLERVGGEIGGIEEMINKRREFGMRRKNIDERINRKTTIR